MDLEKCKKIRKELDQTRAGELQQKQKEAHWMKCPKCGSDLEEINYQRVMIDRCNACKGIWLDSGELELLTEGRAQLTKGFFNKIFS
jgi:acetyl-CoA carboxylase beta subunit